jgi:putative FmdB family regulatory protein
MPIYEFRCGNCRQNFDKLCALGESGKNLKCPACGAGHPERVMSSFSTAGTGGGKGAGSCGTCSSGNCSTCGH